MSLAAGDSRGGAALFDTVAWVRGLERLFGNLWDMAADGMVMHLASA